MKEMIAFIPARSGSKRLRDKNRVIINDESLIYRTLSLINKCKFSQIIFNTDSIDYFEETAGLKVQCDLRPLELGGDEAKTSDVIIDWLSRTKVNDDSIIFLFQVTSPFRSKDLIMAFKNRARFLKHGELLMCVTKLKKISKINEKSFVIPLDYSFGTRSQDVKSEFVMENGLGYAITVKTLLNEQSLFPPKVISFPTNSYCLDLDIDKDIDYKIAKILIENGI